LEERPGRLGGKDLEDLKEKTWETWRERPGRLGGGKDLGDLEGSHTGCSA